MPLNRAVYPEFYLSTVLQKVTGRIKVVVVPERQGRDDYSPCAYIRLLQPLDYMRCLGILEVIFTTAEQACSCGGDVVFCHRTSDCDLRQAECLINDAKRVGIPLLYDIDDNLIDIDEEHPESNLLENKKAIIRAFLNGADAVFFSTLRLQQRLKKYCLRSFVVRNVLDQRLFARQWRPRNLKQEFDAHRPVGILYMGTQTHAPDLELISSPLSRIVEEFGEQVRVGLIGVTASSRLPVGVSRVDPPSSVGFSYPAFMSWLSTQSEWQIGVAPLRETSFNEGKSMIKALDYAAMGAMPIVSDVPAYESLSSGAAMKVSNSIESWYGALREAVTNVQTRETVSNDARRILHAEHTLASQLEERLEILSLAFAC